MAGRTRSRLRDWALLDLHPVLESGILCVCLIGSVNQIADSMACFVERLGLVRKDRGFYF